MKTFQRVRCPNCGSYCKRDAVKATSLLRTECGSCDYLMILCEETGRVIESYAPGLEFNALKISRRR